MRHLIYGLLDPFTKELKYVGRSSSGLRRPRSHWESRKILEQNNQCHCWIRSLLKRGVVPEIIVLEEFDFTDDVSERLNAAERFLIASFRASGAILKNITEGGDSFPDTRGAKNGMFGKPHPSRGKKMNLSLDERRRRAERRKGKSPGPMSEEAREVWRSKVTGKKRTPEVRAKQRAAALQVWAERKRKACG